jgi:hypothetical protein
MAEHIVKAYQFDIKTRAEGLESTPTSRDTKSMFMRLAGRHLPGPKCDLLRSITVTCLLTVIGSRPLIGLSSSLVMPAQTVQSCRTVTDAMF